MSRLFENKVAIVTGGSSGIGRATALAFAREGANVTVADVAVDGGRETEDMVKRLGVDAQYVRTDVTSAAEVAAMVEATVKRWGRLDAALNNAGVPGDFTPVTSCDEDEWDRVMRINVKSVYLCMKYEIPAMVASGGGAIVNTSSGAGMRYIPHMATYVTAKHAVIGLTRSAAGDYAQKNIRVNAILPGPTDTPMLRNQGRAGLPDQPNLMMMVPMNRTGAPEEQAAAVIFLCSDQASYITGVPLAVDGGLLA